MSNSLTLTGCGCWGRYSPALSDSRAILSSPIHCHSLHRRTMITASNSEVCSVSAHCYPAWVMGFSAPVVLTELTVLRCVLSVKITWMFRGSDEQIVSYSWEYENNRPSTDNPAFLFFFPTLITKKLFLFFLVEVWGVILRSFKVITFS